MDRIGIDGAYGDAGVDEGGERCAALPLRSSWTLFFSSATNRMSTPRFFARSSAFTNGTLEKL